MQVGSLEKKGGGEGLILKTDNCTPLKEINCHHVWLKLSTIIVEITLFHLFFPFIYSISRHIIEDRLTDRQTKVKSPDYLRKRLQVIWIIVNVILEWFHPNCKFDLSSAFKREHEIEKKKHWNKGPQDLGEKKYRMWTLLPPHMPSQLLTLPQA